MSSKRIYNMVLKATDVCPEGELLTDKELERMKLNNVKRDWPETSKVKVYGEDVYFNFGVRFATVIHGCWQEIRYSKRGGRPFITMFGKRLYLDEFVRNNSGF